MAYTKPHLSYSDLAELLVKRKIEPPEDASQMVRDLANIGYYRATAYILPFRLRSHDGTLEEDVRPGTKWEHVMELVRFDHKLRAASLPLLAMFEVALRARLAHELGALDPRAHLQPSFLHEKRCADPSYVEGATVHEEWVKKFRSLEAQKQGEAFVEHHNEVYSDDLPIWKAIELIDFGATVRLYRLSLGKTQNQIAKSFGYRNGTAFRSILMCLNYYRNLCAHHSRIWNRTPTLMLPTLADDDFLFPAPSRGRTPGRISSHLVVLAYFGRVLEPSGTAVGNLRTVLRKFPTLPGQGISEVGFEADWQQDEVWSAPQSTWVATNHA